MTAELELISAAIKNREAHAQASDLLDFSDWSPIANRIFKAIGEYYEKDVEPEKANPQYVFKYATRNITSDDQKEQVHDLIQTAMGLDISAKNVVSLAIEVRRKSVGLKLAEDLCDGKHDTDNFHEYSRLVEAEDLSNLIGDEITDLEINELFDVIDPKNKIKLYPASLNERLGGGVVPGDTIIVYGRPNAGKTAFAITNIAGLASRGHKVLYAGNEDAIKKIIVRVVSCLTGKNAMELMKDPQASMELARRRGYCNIVFAHPVSTLGHLASLARKHKAEIVVVDQLRNLKVAADNRVGQLEASAIGGRRIAAEQKFVAIEVTQAGDSAEGKLKLGMGDIDNSKTGIPGACDIMIGLGLDPMFLQNNSRMINITKCKEGNQDSWPVKIDPNISRYYDE